MALATSLTLQAYRRGSSPRWPGRMLSRSGAQQQSAELIGHEETWTQTLLGVVCHRTNHVHGNLPIVGVCEFPEPSHRAVERIPHLMVPAGGVESTAVGRSGAGVGVSVGTRLGKVAVEGGGCETRQSRRKVRRWSMQQVRQAST
eukprot:5722240-Prymnesium_polylepis.1